MGTLILGAGLLWLICARLALRPGLVLGIALVVRLAFLCVPFHSDDVYRYVWEGLIQHAGFSPYDHAPSDPALKHLRKPTHALINHPDLPAIYPPLAQALFFAATGLGLEERGMAKLMLLLDMAVVLALYAWLRSRWVILYAWCPLAVAGPVGGHLDPLMLLCLVGCAWAFGRRRFHLAAALLGAAVLSKAVAVLLLPWLLVRRPRAALTALLVVAAGYALYGFKLGSLVSFATQFTFNASLFRLFGPFSAILLLLWVVWVTFSQPRLPTAAALLFAGLLVLSPTVHFWYLSWFLVFLPAIGPRRWTEPLLLWCVTVSVTYATYANMPPFREFYALTLLEYAPPALLALWLLLRHWPRRVPALAPDDQASSTPRSYGVVIPCRGEAQNLRVLLPRWKNAARVIVADTPTSDGTKQLCATLPNVTYVPVHTRGYGAAVMAGLEALHDQRYAIVCDADHLAGPEQADALLAPFCDETVGLVTAARSNLLPLAQRFGNALATFLIALGWGRRFCDLGPFRALRLPAADLQDRGFGWNVEMNVRTLERGMKVVEIDLPASERVWGRDQISGTLAGVVGAGVGILRQLYRLRERSCRQPS